jgi:hypothetical protein
MRLPDQRPTCGTPSHCVGHRFDSDRRLPRQRPCPLLRGGFLLTVLLTAASLPVSIARAKMSAAGASALEPRGRTPEGPPMDPRAPRRAATTCTGTPASRGVVAWICRRSCKRACGCCALSPSQ